MLEKVKETIEILGRKIETPINLYPTYNHSIDFAHPHIEILEHDILCYVIVERGIELKRECYVDINELLYVVFSDITFSMAMEFELKNRISGEDFRRQLFKKQIELMTSLDIKWGGECKKRIDVIVKNNPFTDK